MKQLGATGGAGQLPIDYRRLFSGFWETPRFARSVPQATRLGTWSTSLKMRVFFSAETVSFQRYPYPDDQPKSHGARSAVSWSRCVPKNLCRAPAHRPLRTCSGHRGCLTGLGSYIEKTLALHNTRLQQIVSTLRNRNLRPLK